jgi:ribose transport system permease protein/inositol transport system permease protein
MKQNTPSAPRPIDWTAYASQLGAGVLIAICIIFALIEPAFVSSRNIFNVLRQVSIYGLLAVGMTFVILTGGIDLSIGSLLALAGLGLRCGLQRGWGCFRRVPQARQKGLV